MPARRLFLFAIIFGLLTAVLAARHAAHAHYPNSASMGAVSETEELGDYLWIIKSADPPYVIHGEPVKFTIVVINTSPQFDMVNVTVNDLQAPGCFRELGEIKFNEPKDYDCWYGNVTTAFTNTAIVTGETDKGKPDEASATADVEVLELTATIEPESSAIPSPGGELQFSITIRNLSSVAIILDSLVSSQLGNLADPQNGKLDPNTCTNAIGRQLAANGGQYGCTFTTDVSGPADDYAFDVTATASVKNAPAYTVSETDETTVEIFETISTSLTTKKTQYATGSLIKLTATINNKSEFSSVDILTLEDAVLGDVGPPIGNCTLPKTIQPGDSYSCEYQQTVTAAAGDDQTFILDVTAETNETPPLAISDRASVTLTAVNPLSFLPITPVIPYPKTCTTALNIEADRDYSFLADLEDAYYRFELTKTSDLRLVIDNFTSRDGQVELFRFDGEDCKLSTKVQVDHDGGNDLKRELVGKAQPPDTYYIWVGNGWDTSSTAYSLIVYTE